MKLVKFDPKKLKYLFKVNKVFIRFHQILFLITYYNGRLKWSEFS